MTDRPIDPKEVEVVARILESKAWKVMNGVTDSYAYQSRRTSSIRKAEKAITALDTLRAGKG